MTAPLAGITIVEAATYITGPLAARTLADFGAHVVKVEPPSGDAFRRDPQIVHNGTYEIVDDPNVGHLRKARHPARWRP